MREIKFRAWDGKEMHYELTHMIAPNGMAYPLIRLEAKEIVINNGADADVVIQQFTGLKDSEGQEIYEGDIVKARWDGDDEPIIFAIEWSEEGGYFAPKEMGCDYIPSLGHDELELEIIGNIYENKELLS